MESSKNSEKLILSKDDVGRPNIPESLMKMVKQVWIFRLLVEKKQSKKRSWGNFPRQSSYLILESAIHVEPRFTLPHPAKFSTSNRWPRC